jgi:predicted DNA-binding transcriptional regulator YafY
VYTGLRWHVRAWCEKNHAYRDFVLSRFRGAPDIMDESEHGVEGDVEWNTDVTVRITPDPRLSAAQREVVEADFGMEKGALKIRTRGKLVPYVLKLLHIDAGRIADDATAQQIVVANRTELEAWLF